jgi:hypothetical protein
VSFVNVSLAKPKSVSFNTPISPEIEILNQKQVFKKYTFFTLYLAQYIANFLVSNLCVLCSFHAGT